MTTPLTYIVRAQDAEEAAGGKRNDWERVAVRIAYALWQSEQSSSHGHGRRSLFAGVEAKDLRLDDKEPVV